MASVVARDQTLDIVLIFENSRKYFALNNVSLCIYLIGEFLIMHNDCHKNRLCFKYILKIIYVLIG